MHPCPLEYPVTNEKRGTITQLEVPKGGQFATPMSQDSGQPAHFLTAGVSPDKEQVLIIGIGAFEHAGPDRTVNRWGCLNGETHQHESEGQEKLSHGSNITLQGASVMTGP